MICAAVSQRLARYSQGGGVLDCRMPSFRSVRLHIGANVISRMLDESQGQAGGDELGANVELLLRLAPGSKPAIVVKAGTSALSRLRQYRG